MAYKSNINKIIRSLESRDAKAIRAMELGMVQGMRFFEGRILKNQFSGRPGLRAVTGTARRSWLVRVQREGDDTIVKLLNARRAFYVIFHQKPPPNTSMAPRIPKRLFIYEDYAKSGRKIIAKKIAEALHREYAK